MSLSNCLCHICVMMIACLAACLCLTSIITVTDAVKVQREPHRLYTPSQFESQFAHSQPSAVSRVLREHKEFQRSGSKKSLVSSTNFRSGQVHHVQGGLLALGFYFVNVSVGTPSQQFSLLLDTGSSNIGIAGARGCASGPQKSCSGASHVYDSHASSTSTPIKFDSPTCSACNPDSANSNRCVFGQPFPAVGKSSLCGVGISYGGGSSYIQGHLVQDRVELDGLVVEQQLLTSIDRMIPNDAFDRNGVQGIIGFAHELNACTPSYSPTLYHNLRASSPANATGVIGLCIDPVNGGSIDFAGADSSKYSGALQWVPIVQERWYNMNVLDVMVDTTSLDLPSFVYGFANDAIGAFVDSGTSALLFGPTPFNHIMSLFRQMNLPGVDGIIAGQCLSSMTEVSKYPNIHIVLSGVNGAPVTLTVPSSSYFLSSAGQFCFAISGVPSIGIVMGDVVMENYYIAHDQANNRVGFAPVRSCV